MKTYLLSLFACILLVELFTGPVADAYMPGSGIENTPHDLSVGSAYYRTNLYNPEGEKRICIFCHIPKTTLAEIDITSIPIWVHASSLTKSFTLYSSGTATPGSPSHQLSAGLSEGPGPVSKFCLSCHDGTVAVNRYGSVSGNRYIRETFQIGAGGALANQHPIGFLYASVRDDEIAQDAQIGSYSLKDILREGRLECPSCHDVHNHRNTGEKFLRMSDRNSNLCCSCHLKCSR